MSASRAQNYAQQKGWASKPSGTDQLAIERCPICGKDDYKFYINVSGEAKDGLWQCFVCGEKGSLYQLQVKLGERVEGMTSLQDMAAGSAPPLPDVAAAKYRLHRNEEFGDVLDYLVAERGFTVDVIEKMSLGAEEFMGKKWVLMPYFDKHGNTLYVKYRSVPPATKEFRSSPGREVPLYNEAAIVEGMDEVLFVEGEADTLACLSYGITAVVGVPGANVKKASWLVKLDKAAPKKIYLLYDKDKVGQQAARDIASRIGIELCYNIVLPDFLTKDGKPGKDINEWFRAGHTLEEFERLKSEAKAFDVQGVQSLPCVINELLDDAENRGTKRAELSTPWPSLDARLGGASYGEVIGIIAEGKVGKTTAVMNWLDYYASEKDIPSMLLCLEMKQKALVRKWLCFKTSTDDKDFAKETILSGLERAKSMKADYLFGFCRSNPEEVFNMIRQAVRRYGVKVVAFDNLQFLVRSIDHSAQETAKLSKQFKELAMELNILILLVIQPNRVREGEIVAARNANGSSAIEKDVDAMIALHRNRQAKVKAQDFDGYLETDENFEPQLLVRVDLSRYAPGGVCTLIVEGAKSTIRELSDADRVALKAPRVGLANIPLEERTTDTTTEPVAATV